MGAPGRSVLFWAPGRRAPLTASLAERLDCVVHHEVMALTGRTEQVVVTALSACAVAASAGTGFNEAPNDFQIYMMIIAVAATVVVSAIGLNKKIPLPL